MIGISYFPHFVKPTDAVRLVQIEFGIIGYAIIYKLYERIFSNGYYCSWNDKILKLFALEDCRTDVETVAGIVDLCLSEGVFSDKLFEKYQILTSAEIQRAYYFALFLKKDIEFDSRFCLINLKKEKKKITEAYYPGSADDKNEIFKLYLAAAECNSVGSFFKSNKRLSSYLEYLDPACLIYAFELCLIKGKKNSDYLFGIINNLKNYNVMYLEDVSDPLLSDLEFMELINKRMESC